MAHGALRMGQRKGKGVEGEVDVKSSGEEEEEGRRGGKKRREEEE